METTFSAMEERSILAAGGFDETGVAAVEGFGGSAGCETADIGLAGAGGAALEGAAGWLGAGGMVC